MVSNVLAQAILNQQAPDLVGSFDRGREQARQSQVRDLTGQALQQGGGRALEQLQGIDPQVALALGSEIQARSANDLNEFVRDAGIGQRMLQQGDVQGFLSFADQRSNILRQQGRDSTQTDEMADLVRAGRSDEALGQLQAFTGAVEQARAPVNVGANEQLVDPQTGEVIFSAKDAPKAESDEQTFKRSQAIRKEIDANTKDFVKVRDAFGRIDVSEDSAVGDIALIFNFMKMLDPGSVVREREFATAQNAAGVPERIRNSFNKLMSGERLAPDQRKSFSGQARKLFERAKKSTKRLVDQRLSVGKRFGLTKKDVFGDMDFFDPNAAVAAPQEQQQQQRNISVDF